MNGKTVVEKILSSASRSDARAGEIVDAEVSYVMTNDAVGELTVEALEELGASPWDSNRTIVILDHYIPASSEHAARVHAILRRFARDFGTPLFDQRGVCHQIMLEHYLRPGDLVIGTDSHTCTYGAVGAFATGVGSTDGAAAIATGRIWLKVPETIRVELRGSLRGRVSPKDAMLHIVGGLGADGATYQALLFTGPGAASIDHAGRCTMCNMAIEAGAKAGMFEPDEVTAAFLASNGRGGELVSSDPDAEFSRTLAVDLDRLAPQVSRPWSVDNVVAVSEAIGTRIDQAFLGSCTNGRIADLRIAAAILCNAHVHRNVRLLVTPASQGVYRQALAEGVIERLVDAGAIICNPGCSACFGGQGMLWDGEVCIGTHNRNFRGRMGHPNSQVYLASPETVAVSAIAGEIADPRGFRGGI